MAAKDKPKPVIFQIPKDTEVDVYAIKGNEVKKTTMTFEQSLNIKKKQMWFYRVFQKGFSDMKATN